MACTTSEKYEHYFGCCRTKKRELTCSDFVSYVEGLEIALQQMGFAQITKETGNTIAQSPGYVNEEDEWGIDVDYSYPVAPQIEEFVLLRIYAVDKEAVVFLCNGLRVSSTDLSPFAK
eukprot:7451221-Ditylum_brightwellii.AAC.1